MHARAYKFRLKVRISVLLYIATTISAAHAAPPPADAILDAVLAQMPRSHITATGTMFVRQRRGVPVHTYRFEMDASWKQGDTSVSYRVHKEDGTPIEAITFRPDQTNSFAFRQGPDLLPAPLPDLTASIAQTDVSWLDLTLHFLWWRGARHVGEDTVRGFHCYTIEVDAPPGYPHDTYRTVRLWISSEQGMLLQAEGFGADQIPIRRLWVQSVRQVDDQWMIQTLEVQQTHRDQRTRLEIVDIVTGQDPA